MSKLNTSTTLLMNVFLKMVVVVGGVIYSSPREQQGKWVLLAESK